MSEKENLLPEVVVGAFIQNQKGAFDIFSFFMPIKRRRI